MKKILAMLLVVTLLCSTALLACVSASAEGSRPRGDADMDGEVTILDATRIQRFLAGLAAESDIDADVADADSDGDVTILDATRVQRYLAGLCDMDGNPAQQPTEVTKPDFPVNPDRMFKAGVILLHDENSTTDYLHINAVRSAAKELGLDDSQIILKKNISESASAYYACCDLVDMGCSVIFSTSYGHQSYMEQAAREYPDVQFVAISGDNAKASGLKNLSNAYPSEYEIKYVSGVVAGMKLRELIESESISADNMDSYGNIKIGYVGTFTYAEVISAFTAYYLGVKSVVPNVVMDVEFTNDWYWYQQEIDVAQDLISRGCVIISSSTESLGAAFAVSSSYGSVYSVGNHLDASVYDHNLTSSMIDWTSYYKYAVSSAQKGVKIAADWAGGLSEGAVTLSDLSGYCAEGTAEKVDQVIADIKSGKLHVFDRKSFTVNGNFVNTAYATDTDGDWENDTDNAMFDGYFHESYFRSAPYFDLLIDGITLVNLAF